MRPVAASRPAQERPPIPDPMTMQSTSSSAMMLLLSGDRLDLRRTATAGGGRNALFDAAESRTTASVAARIFIIAMFD